MSATAADAALLAWALEDWWSLSGGAESLTATLVLNTFAHVPEHWDVVNTADVSHRLARLLTQVEGVALPLRDGVNVRVESVSPNRWRLVPSPDPFDLEVAFDAEYEARAELEAQAAGREADP